MLNECWQLGTVENYHDPQNIKQSFILLRFPQLSSVPVLIQGAASDSGVSSGWDSIACCPAVSAFTRGTASEIRLFVMLISHAFSLLGNIPK